jgi:SAM-dependent methyltransferase
MEENSYDFFAKDYHNKRRYHWRDLENFLRELNDKKVYFNGYNLDLGCANGRNFNLFLQSNSKLIGIDNSIELLRLARERLKKSTNNSNFNPKSIYLVLSDVKALPLRPNAITNIFSIATIHHIKKNIQRNYVLSQIYNIMKNDGFLVLTVWRRYQKKYRFYFISDRIRRFFIPKYSNTQKELGLIEYGDKYIPWTLSNKNITYNRYYHFFSLKEIKKLLKNYIIRVILKKGGPNKKDNFFILTQKVVNEKK